MINKNVDTKKLQELIYSKFSNYQDFINACSIKNYKPSMSSVKSWFGNNPNGTRSPSLKHLHIIADILEIPMEELLTHSTHSKLASQILKIPVFETPAGCGSMGEFDSKFSMVREVDMPKIFFEQMYPNPEHLMIFKCFGDSLYPKYNSGDFVIVDMVNGRNFIKIDGIYVFRLEEIIYVKRLTFTPDKIVAKSINPDYENFEINKNYIGSDLFEILGKVCGRITFEEGLLLENQRICKNL